MTWITDGSGRGTRWVEISQRKRRKPGRALRFANIKIGDQLMQTTETQRTIPNPDAANAACLRDQWKTVPYAKGTTFWIVTDLWFDPVRGQSDPIAGQMVGIARVNQRGEIDDYKNAYPVRGLASQQFHYADRDYIAWCKERAQAMQARTVVDIGHGKTIRKRPKLPRACL